MAELVPLTVFTAIAVLIGDNDVLIFIVTS